MGKKKKLIIETLTAKYIETYMEKDEWPEGNDSLKVIK